jgi:hypothetical protein
MRRIVYVLVATGLAATGAFSAAQAKQVIPMHTQDVTKTVTQAFRSVAVSADYGGVTLKSGSTTTIRAHEEWNVRQPTFDVAVSHGVLDVTISCNGDVSVGSVVTVAGALDQANDCIDALTLTLPAKLPVQADTYSGDITSTGGRGGVKLSTGSGDVTVRDARGPQVAASSGNGTVDASGIDASSVSLDSDSGDAIATGVRATA